jgi:hypothetical protein
MDDNLSHIKAVLRTTPKRWTNISQVLSETLLHRAPAQEEWSAAECLLHLLDTERHVFPVRVRYFLADEDLPAFDPETQGASLTPRQSVEKLAEEFADLRQSSLDLLEELDPKDLGRTAIHEEIGEVTLGELMNEWAAHDFVHTMQAERAVMQPFIHLSGPWRKFFEEHIIGGA